MRSASRKLRSTFIAYAFLAPALIVLLLFFVYPVARGFRLSFFEYDPITQVEKYIGTANFTRLAADAEFRTALINSFKYLIVVPIIIAFSLGLALLVEPRLPGVYFFRAAYYIPVVTTMVVVGITWRYIFNEDEGLLNKFLDKFAGIHSAIPWMTESGLVLGTVMTVTIWKGLGYYMVIFIAALRAIPAEVIEAAVVDGAKPSQVFWRVKLPMLWPSISLVAVLSSIAALQVFDEIYVMTAGKIREAITLVYYIYETGFDTRIGSQEYGYASAMAVVLFGILVVFTGINQLILRKRGYQGE